MQWSPIACDQTPDSLFSLSCNKGESEVLNRNSDICCFTFQKCTHSQVFHNNACVECVLYERTYYNYQTCNPLPTADKEMTDAVVCTILLGSSFCMLTNTTIIASHIFEFQKHKNIQRIKPGVNSV